MPNPTAFLKKFKLTHVGDFQMYNYDVKHTEVVRYREYSYSGILYYDGKGNYEDFKREFNHKVSESVVVFSDYGNPYECHIESVRFQRKENDIIVTFLGRAFRIK